MGHFIGWFPIILVFLGGGAFGSSAFADPSESVIARGHAHNDYMHAHPLQDALENGFQSVEADIRFIGGELRISHVGLCWLDVGTLKDLYLDPLQRRVDRMGSVHGDGKPFYLWLDIKNGGPRLLRQLWALLPRYPMLTKFSEGGGEAPGPVTIILTGDESAGMRYIQGTSWKWASRSTREYSEQDPAGDREWHWYSLDWGNYIGWDGRYPAPPEALDRLGRLVRDIHAKGRRVRFWNVPNIYPAWKALLDAGADQISVDALGAYRSFARHPQDF